MFSGYTLENCSFLKGKRGGVDMEEERETGKLEGEETVVGMFYIEEE